MLSLRPGFLVKRPYVCQSGREEAIDWMLEVVTQRVTYTHHD
jgi:hypothetical protein